VVRLVSLVAVFIALAGCGGEQENAAITHDLGVLGGGVDPGIEAEAVATGLERSGYVIGTELEGQGWVAFDATHDRDGRTAIRVITRRGMAVVLDVPESERERGIALRRVTGIAELVVARADPAHDRECLVLLRVEDDGRVSQVPLELGRFGADACVEAIQDVGSDERPELLTRIRADALSRGEVPTVTAVLEVRGEGYSPAPPNAFRAFWETEEGRIREALADARSRLDIELAYRSAVELAVMARETGGSDERQLSAFDEALRGLVLTEAQARGVAAARTHVADGWPE